MWMPTLVLRRDYDAVQVRRLALKVSDVDQVRRLLAIAAAYEGKSRGEAARIGGMDRQTLRDWVVRFNADGPEGLINRTAPGNARRLTKAQEGELAELVEAGPAAAGLTHLARWRCQDLKALIFERFSVDYHERSVGKLLERLGFSHITARPQHRRQDAEALATFKKTSPRRWRRSAPSSRPARP
jgi:transposase